MRRLGAMVSLQGGYFSMMLLQCRIVGASDWKCMTSGSGSDAVAVWQHVRCCGGQARRVRCKRPSCMAWLTAVRQAAQRRSATRLQKATIRIMQPE